MGQGGGSRTDLRWRRFLLVSFAFNPERVLLLTPPHNPMLPFVILLLLFSFLIGSIPFGFLIARSKGVDIRQHGSGNIGATNVFRTLGKKWGVLVFVLDALKGALPVALAGVASQQFGILDPALASVLAGIATILGHNFTPWLGFKGGKGIATSAGVLLALVPVASLCITVVWFLVFKISRYVSLASIAAAISLPIAVGILLYLGWLKSPVLLAFSILATLLAVWQHRSNIQRLLNGTESRFEKKRSTTPATPHA